MAMNLEHPDLHWYFPLPKPKRVRPAKLAELVPNYLDEVPRDPMAPDGATIRYRPQAEVPVLYSVGRNGIDDGGLVWDEKGKKYDRHNRRDLVFLLDGALPGVREGD